jgi:flagella basal body P-ring formation protein FlgA
MHARHISLLLLLPLAVALVAISPARATDSQTLNAGWLLETARSTILTSEPWKSAGVTVETTNTPADITVYRSGQIQVAGKLAHTPNSLRDLGAVTVEVSVGGELYMRFDPGPYLTVSVDTFTSTRDSDRGDVLAESDVAQAKTDVRSLPPSDLFTAMDQIVGRAAKANIQSGRVLTLNMLELPTLVKRGESVIVYVPIGGAAVTLNGIALDSGALGDQIRVRNPDSKVIITARVTGPSRAQLVIPR